MNIKKLILLGIITAVALIGSVSMVYAQTVNYKVQSGNSSPVQAHPDIHREGFI